MTEQKNILEYKDYLLRLRNIGLINKNKELDHWGNYPIKYPYLRPLYTIFKSGFKFLDLGSGAGQVLKFASNIGYEVTGVEFDKKLVSLHSSTIFKDIREIDFSFYKDFDVIYSYKPIKNDDEFKLYLETVASSMKLSSYLLIPDTIMDSNYLTRVLPHLYKIKNK